MNRPPLNVNYCPFVDRIERAKQPLGSESKWRLDPQKSLSDWTLEVVAKDDGDGAVATKTKSVTKYHVHRADLVVGVRKSEYFETMFQNPGSFTETIFSTTRVEFPGPVAEVVPLMLDFMYSSTKSLDMEPENLAALYVLADYFGIDPMKYEINQSVGFFIKAGWMDVVYPMAAELQCAHILDLMKLHVAINIRSINDDFVSVADMSFWKDIFEVVALSGDEFNCKFQLHEINSVVARIMEWGDENGWSQETFEWLVDPRVLPTFTAASALSVCRFVDQEVLEANMSLRKRCIDALAKADASMDLACHDPFREENWKMIETNCTRDFVDQVWKQNRKEQIALREQKGTVIRKQEGEYLRQKDRIAELKDKYRRCKQELQTLRGA
ncbi:MAG: hypothetical protein SGILL_008321 [Bacillariaceae sp.]